MTVRRIKSYSAETGYVYQYCLEDSRSGREREGRAGDEYLFRVSSDRKTQFELPVFLEHAAVAHWGRERGRELSGPEQFAAVKMRLFQAFDEVEDLEAARLQVAVTAANIGDLLGRLEIE